ncbi:MAG: hypothetical protein JJT96_17935 [Opitutales bacterium]|nr:hypothetical protein [Opitutales bacterium]
MAEGSGLLSKIRAFSEGWVIGSVAWVESFGGSNGWLGFRRGRKAKPVGEDSGADLVKVATAVRRQCGRSIATGKRRVDPRSFVLRLAVWGFA